MNVEDYYQETDPEKRKEILSKMLAEDNSEENQKRLELFDARYFYSKGRNKQLADSFMGVLMDIKAMIGNTNGVMSGRSIRRQAQKYYKTLQIQKFSDEGELSRQLLYMEFYHLMSLYVKSSLGDKKYGTTFMGLMKPDEESMQLRLVEDFFHFGWEMPQRAKMTQEFSLFTQAAYDAFCELLPDCSENLMNYVNHKL